MFQSQPEEEYTENIRNDAPPQQQQQQQQQTRAAMINKCESFSGVWGFRRNGDNKILARLAIWSPKVYPKATPRLSSDTPCIPSSCALPTPGADRRGCPTGVRSEARSKRGSRVKISTRILAVVNPPPRRHFRCTKVTHHRHHKSEAFRVRVLMLPWRGRQGYC